MSYPIPPPPFSPLEGSPPADANAVSQAPVTPATSASEHEKKQEEAARALQGEQHEPLGLLDTLQTMFMWQESPSERVEKNRALGIEPPTLPRLPLAPALED
jgi:hypothetical protein